MTTSAALKTDAAATVAALTKANPAIPALRVTSPRSLAVLAGTIVVLAGVTQSFAADTPVTLPDLVAGWDYVVALDEAGAPVALPASRFAATVDPRVFAGFHVAAGEPAEGRSGGSDVLAIWQASCWDLNFRPACPDPRGMAHVSGSPGKPDVAAFWVDIYLTAADHLEGTSRFGVTIADGRNRPVKVEGSGRYSDFDWHAATAVLAHHGKQLLSVFEFFAAAYGVTEKTAAADREENTVLDVPRTSRFMIGASGQRWQWGHDADPDDRRAALFGGSYWIDDDAGSRQADVGYWPDNSSEFYGARGRSDHLTLV